MSQQIQITGGAKVRALEGVITGTSGVLSSVPLGAANGVATLDSGGKVPVSQLPSSVVTYLGTWNAATNTPTLVNGTGDAGDMYICNVAGTVNFGAGPVVFVVGDWVLYGSGTWQKSSGQNGTVTSVSASITGSAIGVTGSPITTAGTLAFAFAGTNLEYVNGAGNLTTFPTLTGFIPYTGATTAIDLNAKTVVNISHLGVNTTSVPTILIRAVGDNNSSSRIAMRGYSSDANSSSIRVTKFRGTVGAPQAPQSGDSLGKFELAGYGTTSSDGYPQASFEGLATESWGATARGTKVVIKVTPNTTITQAVALTINQDKSAVFENSITGTSLIKTGGTSSQFLKADGTVDSNTYALDSAVVHNTGNETIGGTKTFSDATKNNGGIFLQNASSSSLAGYMNLGGLTNGVKFTSGGGISNNFTLPSATGYTFTFPNATGTLALTSDISYPVTSVFGRTGAVVATSGDYTTTQVTEGTNLYYTDVRARASLSFVAGSGAYNSTTGVITIPTNNNQITNGAAYITLTSLSAGVGISYNNTTGVITNSAPDQTVSLTAGAGISVSGTYPSFTIASTITQYTDALARASISLTTTGTSGAATYNSTTGVLNIPQYIGGVTSVFGRTGAVVATEGDYSLTQLSDVTITSPTTGQVLKYNGTAWINDTDANSGTVTSVGLSSATSGVTIGSSPITTSGTITLAIATATTSQNGLLSSTDWTTFNNKQSSLTFSSPLVNTSGTVSIPVATTSVNGYLSSTDWTTFNNKQGAITLTTTGTSGAATLVGNTLNIPQYSGGGGSITLSAIGSTPNANAATLTGSALNLEPASASFGGVVTTGTQTFAGEKTFTNSLTLNYAAVDVDLNVKNTQSSGVANLYLRANANGAGDIRFSRNSDNSIQGRITYSFTDGSMNFRTGGTDSRLIISSTGASTFNSSVTASSFIKSGGTSAQILAADGSVITAGTNITISGGTISASGGGGGSISLSAIGSTPNANAATLTGSVLNLEPASASFGGVVTTGTQTFAGNKTLTGTLSAKTSISVSNNGGQDVTLSATSTFTDGYDAILQLNNTHTGGQNWNIRSTNNSQGNFGGGKLVFSNQSAGVANATMILTGSGDVGINTITIGASKFQVNGSAAIGYSASTAAPAFGLAVSGAVTISNSQSAASAITIAGRIESTVGNNSRVLYCAGASTGWIILYDVLNTTGRTQFIQEGSTAGTSVTGSTAYSTLLGAVRNDCNLQFFTNSIVRQTINGATGAATFTSSVTATSFFESSDSRLKTLIQDNYQTKGIASITPKLYTKNGKVELGYYAQDLVGILDSAVVKGSDDMLSLSYREVLVAKVYALEQRIKELETK